MELDRQLLLMLNGSGSLFLDGVMTGITSGFTWIPLYIALVFLIIRNNENMSQIMIVFGCYLICFLLSEGVCEGIVKPLAGRLRPTYDPMVRDLLLVDGITGAQPFSFFSAHASNTFGIALFICLVVREWRLSTVMVVWSLLNGYSRIYLGVHYPGDVLAGFLWGAVSAIAAYLVFRKLNTKVSPEDNYVSTEYTSTGYRISDVQVVISVLVYIFVYIFIRAFYV